MKSSPSPSVTPQKRKILEKVLSGTKSIIDYFSPSSTSPKKNDEHGGSSKISGVKLEMSSPNANSADISIKGEQNSSSVKKRRLDPNPLVNATSNENSSNDDQDSTLGLGLVRVDSPGITLQELTDFFGSLQKKEYEYKIHPLFSGAILGRNVSSANNSIQGKVPIDIDKSENGVSRKQIKVESIIKSNIQRNSAKRRLSSLKSQMEYVEDVQSSMPSIKISCAPDAVNPVLVCKVRCNHKYLKGKTKGKGLALRNQVDVLHKGNSVVLHVGDAIEFDLYNRSKEVDGNKTNYFSAQDSGKYVYRIVAYERNEKDRSLIQSLKGVEKEERCISKNTDLIPCTLPMEDSKDKGEINDEEDPPLAVITNSDSSSITSGTKPCGTLEEKDSVNPSKTSPPTKPQPLDVTVEMIDACFEVTPDPTPTSSEGTLKQEKISSCDNFDYVPQVGDLFRIGMFDKDLFSSKKSLKWYIGTAVNVKPKGRGGKYSIQFQFQDSITCVEDFPHKYVVPVVKKQDSIYRTACCEDSDIFALDSNPKELFLGDFVECKFQNGAHDGRWWCGRVASINEDKNTVDVAYFDENYEKDVPIKGENIRLLERGTFKAEEWMIGATLIKEKGSPLMKVVKISTSKNLSPEYDMSDSIQVIVKPWRVKNGKEITLTYQEAAKKIFSDLLQKRKNEQLKTGEILVLSWPTGNKNTYSPGPIRVMKPTRTIKAEETAISDVASNTLREFSAQQNENMEMSQNSNASLDDDEPLSSSRFIREISPVMANACWRALDSAEPHVGYGYLIHMLSVANMIPNKSLADRLFQFVLHGPMLDDAKYNEPQKTHLVFDYIDRLAAKKDLIEMMHPIAPKDFSQFEMLIKSPLNGVEKTLPSTKSASKIRRSSSSFYHTRKAITFAERNISNELNDLITDSSNFDQKILRTLPFVSTLLKEEPRKLLQVMTEIIIKTWLKHGHWIVGFVGEGKRRCSTLDESRCSMEVYETMKALGRILCHVAWLFCATESLPFPDYQCCYVIRDIVLRELECFEFNEFCDGKATKTLKNQFSRDLKLRFILSLEASFATNLLVRIGELLDLEEEVSMILG